MKLEQCDKAPDHLRCVRFKGHDGECDNMCATAFNNALQAAEDELLYGNVVRVDGKPAGLRAPATATITLECPAWDAPVTVVDGSFKPDWPVMRESTLCEPVNPGVSYSGGELMDSYQSLQTDFDAKVKALDEVQDATGKAWDVLHEAGINGGGGVMSLAEAIKALILKLEPNPQLQAYQKPSICDKCNGCGWEQPDVAIEQCSKCGGAGIAK